MMQSLHSRHLWPRLQQGELHRDYDDWYIFESAEDLLACFPGAPVRPTDCWSACRFCKQYAHYFTLPGRLIHHRTRTRRRWYDSAIVDFVGPCCMHLVTHTAPTKPCAVCTLPLYLAQLSSSGACSKCQAVPVLTEPSTFGETGKVQNHQISSHYIVPRGKYKRRPLVEVLAKDPQYGRFFLVQELGFDIQDWPQYETQVGPDFILTFGNYIGLSLAQVWARGDWDYLSCFARHDAIAQEKQRLRGRPVVMSADRAKVADYLKDHYGYGAKFYFPVFQ
jgi:hypothetical protein